MAHLSGFLGRDQPVVYSASRWSGSPASPTCVPCIGRCGNGICRCSGRVFCLAPALDEPLGFTPPHQEMLP